MRYLLAAVLAMACACTTFTTEVKSDFRSPRIASVDFAMEVDAASVAALGAYIARANAAGADAIVIRIDSPGGIVPEGMRLAKAIEDSRAPVYCIVDGMAASMAFYILQSCNHRIMTRRSSLMVHEPSTVRDQRGNWQDFMAIVVYLRTLGNGMASHECRRLVISQEDCESHFQLGQEWWLGWMDALKVGAVDTVIESPQVFLEQLEHEHQ